MASYLYRTRGMLQFPRYVPTLIARAQASQNNPPVSSPGQGVPMSGSTKTVSQTGGTKKGDSSVLPSSGTSTDHTNPMKTSSDAPPLDHNNTDGAGTKTKTDKQRRDTTSSSSNKSSSSSSSGDSKKQQSFMSSPVGQFGTIAVVAVALYAGYKMMSGDKQDLKKNDHYKKATADYQAANTHGTDVKK